MTNPTKVSVSASAVPSRMRDLSHYGEETLPTLSVISPPKLLTSPSRTTSSRSSVSRRTMATGDGSPVTSHLEVLLVPLPCCSSTPSTTPVPVLPTTPSPLRVEEPVSSTAWSMSTARLSPPTVLPVFTVDSSPQSLVSSSTVVSTSVCTTPSSPSSSSVLSRDRS